jgi:hypothetical protein
MAAITVAGKDRSNSLSSIFMWIEDNRFPMAPRIFRHLRVR